MSLKPTPWQLRSTPPASKFKSGKPPKKVKNPWQLGGGPPDDVDNIGFKVYGGDENLAAEQGRTIGSAEQSFLDKQEARHKRPKLGKVPDIKVKIPEGGLSPNQIAQYYKLFEEPAGAWRVNVKRTIDGIAFAMVGPRALDPQAEIEKILRLTQMIAIGKDAIEFTNRPIMKGDSKMFKVDIKAKPIYRKE